MADQSSLLSLQQLPDTAELQRASHALYMDTAAAWMQAVFKPGHTSSFYVSYVQERSLLGSLLCQNRCCNWVKAGVSGDES